MQFEAEEPSHGALAFSGYALEYFMNVYSLVEAYPRRSAVNEGDACTFAKKNPLNENGKRDSHVFLKFYKAVMKKK